MHLQKRFEREELDGEAEEISRYTGELSFASISVHFIILNMCRYFSQNIQMLLNFISKFLLVLPLSYLNSCRFSGNLS